MIISRTPFRVSFFGGGTDYEPWYSENGGSILSTAINKYCYISIRRLPPFFDHTIRFVWSKIEEVQTADSIIHPVVRALLLQQNLNNIEIHHNGDLPSRAGLGSSSSFTVGLVNSLAAYAGSLVDKKSLANQAIHIERNILRENVGIQDQIAASYGGMNLIQIEKDGGFKVNPVPISKARLSELERSIMLVYTGVSRFSSEVAKDQVANIGFREEELKQMANLAITGARIVSGTGSLDRFGELLGETWELKKSLSSSISNTDIDNLYSLALKSGALGGKVLGAGGGGFMLLYVDPEKWLSLKSALSNFLVVPVAFDYNGSQIIFYEHDSGGRSHG